MADAEVDDVAAAAPEQVGVPAGRDLPAFGKLPGGRAAHADRAAHVLDAGELVADGRAPAVVQAQREVHAHPVVADHVDAEAAEHIVGAARDEAAAVADAVAPIAQVEPGRDRQMPA